MLKARSKSGRTWKWKKTRPGVYRKMEASKLTRDPVAEYIAHLSRGEDGQWWSRFLADGDWQMNCFTSLKQARHVINHAQGE